MKNKEYNKECSIIVSHKNRLELLKNCLKSIKDYTQDVNYTLYIIDAGSTDGSIDYLLNLTDKNNNEFNIFKVIFENSPSTYAESNNRVMKMCDTPYVYLLNNDCLCLSGWLRNAIDFAENNKDVGHVASLVLYKDLKVQSHGANLDSKGNTIYINNPNVINNYAYAGLGLYRKDILEKVDYMPEYPSKIYWSDTGYCMRVWASGYDVRYCPESKVIHLLDPSERIGHSNDTKQGQEFFMKDWGQFLQENNGFAPNLPFTQKRPYSHIKRMYDE